MSATKPDPVAAFESALQAVIWKKGDDGARAFTDQQLVDFLPLLFAQLGFANEPASLTASQRELFGDFFERIGIGADATPLAMSEALSRHLELHPPPPALEAELSLLVARSWPAPPLTMLDAIRQLTALAQTRPKARVLGGAARPEGTVPGGILARLTASAAAKRSG